MSDLTEFLLARIAEDEAVATMSDGYGTGKLALTPRGIWNGPGQYPVIDARRLHAECEAKRRIVQDRSLRESGRMALSILGERLLAYLALPYADHPDYREEWRVSP